MIANLQMPGGKGDQWIRGLLAQSVDQLKEKSGRVEDARTARQREKDRLARLRGEVSGQVGDSGAARQSERVMGDVSGRDLKQKKHERLATKLYEGVGQNQRVDTRTKGRLQEKKEKFKLSRHAEPSTKTAVGAFVQNTEKSAQEKQM